MEVATRFWNECVPGDYRRMQVRHPALWDFVCTYIATHGIRQVFEVGCGLEPPVRELVPHYTGLDLNENTDAVHADFLTVDVTPWRGVELLLACGVVEHCPGGYETFLRQVKRLEPQHGIVSFFNRLQRPENVLRPGNRGFWFNRYARHRLGETLDALGFQWELKYLARRDAVLLLRGP